jgi:hypothetical protein
VKVQLSKTARKQLTKVPQHIVRKFALWADLVREEGLSQAYRAIYIVREDDSVEMVFVEEVNKHDY